MSTALLEPALLEPKVEQAAGYRPGTLDIADVAPIKEIEAMKFSDPHPLLPVFIAGIISLHLAGAFVGAIFVWLLLRHSGVMAP